MIAASRFIQTPPGEMDSLCSLLGKVRAYCKTPPRHAGSRFMSQSSQKMCFLLGDWAADLLFECLCGLPLGLGSCWNSNEACRSRLGYSSREREGNRDLLRMFLSLSHSALALLVEVTSKTLVTGSCCRVSLNLFPLVKSWVLTS